MDQSYNRCEKIIFLHVLWNKNIIQKDIFLWKFLVRRLWFSRRVVYSNRRIVSLISIEDLSRLENRGRYIFGLESHADRETFSYLESDYYRRGGKKKGQSGLGRGVFYRGYDFAAAFQSRPRRRRRHARRTNTLVQMHRMRWAKDREMMRVERNGTKEMSEVERSKTTGFINGRWYET